MIDEEYTREQIDFLSRFFGPGNLLRWDAYRSGAMAVASRDLLAPLIEDFRKGNLPVLLPRVAESMPAAIHWYAMAHNAREARSLREQLTAFIGPTYTDFNGQHATLDSTDSIERAVSDTFSPHVFRLRVVKNDDWEKVRSQLLLMRSLRDRHPDRTTQLVRPVGRLLRDLEMALVVRNEPSAWQCLDDLRARGRLSSHNLAFLKIRVLAVFERWHDILALPETNSLVTIRRPSNVTHALVKAVYNTSFVEYEKAHDVGACVERYRELEPTFGTLFRARGESRDPTVIKAFLVRSVAARPTRFETVRALVDEFPAGDSGREWVDEVATFASSLADAVTVATPPTPALSYLEKARFACESEDYDLAFQLLAECEPTPLVVRQLLACAIEIDSLEATRSSLAYLEHCSDEVRNAALSMRAYRKMWEDLNQRVVLKEPQQPTEEIPTGWIPWIERLNRSGAWDSAVEIARHGVSEWRSDEFRVDPPRISLFAGLLVASRPRDGETVLRNVLPEMLTHFLPAGAPVREFKPIYLNLAYVLALDDSINADDLAALATLAEAILESAPSASQQAGANEFQELLDTLEAAWNHVAAPRYVDWALQILDLLIGFNVNAHAPVDIFLYQVVSGFRLWSRRIRPDQWDLLEQLIVDLGQQGLLDGLRQQDDSSPADANHPFRQLAGKSVAIYTLTERIGSRAAAVLRSRFDGVKLHLLHDHASTDRLVQLASSADIFIVNTWDAKHAATNAIHAVRSRDSVTLFPRSKSAGSLIRVLYDFLSTQASLATND